MVKVRIFIAVAGLLVAFVSSAYSEGDAGDPWSLLRKRYEGKGGSAENKPLFQTPADTDDPWAKLRAICMPFTLDEEERAGIDPFAAKQLAGKIRTVLQPYQPIIDSASETFQIPVSVLSGLIMVESAGNSAAAARTSSAKGLTQTIDSTFKEAVKGLERMQIQIADNPYNARSSILAGAWYLNRMYETACSDHGTDNIGPRNRIRSWERPLAYYYAGPRHGAKREDVVIIYAGGRRIRVDKARYVKKVMNWAKALELSRAQ